jgi:tetratricopeptide (TPR) repeat protein
MARARFLSASLFIVCVVASAIAQAAAPGDFVFPKTTPGSIKVGDEVVAEVKITDYLKVEKVEGDWLWVECRDLLAPGDEGKKGWVSAGSVDDLETQIRYFEGRANEGSNAGAFFLAGAVASLPDDDQHQNQALDFFTKAINLDGTVAYYHQRRASCYVMLDNYSAAITDLESAARIDPSNTAIPGLITSVRDMQGSAGTPGGGTAPPALDMPPPSQPIAGLGTTPAAPGTAPAPGASTSGGGGSGAVAKGEADPRVRDILVGTNFQYTVNSDGNYKIIYDAGNGRTQVLFVESNIESLGDFEIREIWSPIGQAAEASFSQAIADRLLRIGATMKVGAVEIVTIDNKPTAYFSAKVPANLTAEQLVKVINAVASTADENENALFGGDKY